MEKELGRKRVVSKKTPSFTKKIIFKVPKENTINNRPALRHPILGPAPSNETSNVKSLAP